MLYSLPTGKVIELSIEQYLELTDEELEYLISINYGEAIEDPFFGSILDKPEPIDYIVENPLPPVITKNNTTIDDEIDESIDFNPEEE